MMQTSTTVPHPAYAQVARRAAAIPLLLFVYPALGGLVGGSSVPVYFGRYSTALATFNLFSSIVLLVFAVAWHRNHFRLMQLCLWAILCSTFVVPGNNVLRSLPFMNALLPIIRFVAAAAVIVIEFCRVRETKRPAARAMLVAGSVAATLALFDLALLPFVGRGTDEIRAGAFELARQASQPSPRYVVIGDSCAYGNGVGSERSFPVLLDQELGGDAVHRQVLRLAIPGIGLDEYNRLVRSLPSDLHVERIILSFYWNDLPPIERAADLVQRQAIALGRSAPSFSLIADAVAKAATPTAEDYHRALIENANGDWERQCRWRMLRQGLEEFREAAGARSQKPPILMIIPLMIDYNGYPLDGAHAELAQIATELNYDVVDLLPIFRQVLVDGNKFRAAPNDNHFDASVHELVANVLFEHLEPRHRAAR